MNNLSSFLPTNETKTESCDSHGNYESRMVFRGSHKDIWSGCPQCAAERQATEQREEEERESTERHKAWQKRLGDSGIPDRFHSRTLESYQTHQEGQRRAIAFANEYVATFDQKKGCSAILNGLPGTGKTHIAVGIGLELMKQNKLVLFMTVQRMVRRVKDSWRNESDESESEVIRLLVEPDLLILDEVGVQFGTEYERNLMFDVLNERYEKRKSCILLSNLTVSEVKNFLGERVFDRLREDGGKCVPFDWESYRGMK